MAEVQSIEPHCGTQVETKDIPGWPGFRAGSDGSIWSCWRYKGAGWGRGSYSVMSNTAWHKLKPYTKHRYASVVLRCDGKRGTIHVHRLVALAFHGPCPEGMQVAHENGDSHDCRAVNLSYKTPKDNQKDRTRHGTDGRGERNPHAKITEDVVLSIRSAYANGDRNISDVARKHGVSRDHASKIIHRRSWKHV